jgi:SOS-response transcriptional repressor LexA
MAFILAHFEEFDRLPSIREMREHFTWTSNTIAVRHIKRLVEHGYIEKAGTYYRFSRFWPGRPVATTP